MSYMYRDLKINDYVLQQIFLQGEKAYPNEACGIIIGPKGYNAAVGVFPIKNIQDELHAKDPQKYTRTATTAYYMDPREFKIVEKECEDKEFEFKIFYHSHPDHGVYFSEEDRLMAAPWGEPAYPQVGHIEISVTKGKAIAASEFFWDPEAGDFIERKLLT